MKRFLIACVMVGALAGSAATLLAHHSFAAEFDDTKPLKITGTLTKVEWQNPHIWYYVDVKNPDGTTTTWGVSGGAPGQLMRRGITKELLKVGATVNVEGSWPRTGRTTDSGARVTYADGRNVFTAGRRRISSSSGRRSHDSTRSS